MTDPAARPLAVSYAAKSTADEHDSLPTQQGAIRRRAGEELGRLLVAEYAEANRAGWRQSRGPELERALAKAIELAADQPAVELWVWHSSRLGRGSGLKGEARSLMEVFTHLRRHGVALRSVTDDQFVTSPMLVGFAAEQAEKYSADLSGWVVAGKQRQWERGDWLGGPIPDGLRLAGPKQPRAPAELDLDPDRAPVIRDIFDRALQGVAPAPMARQLNAEGVRTQRGGAWTRRRVQDTLANPVYAGLLVRYRGTDREERQPARHPAIVSPQEFEAVQVLTRGRDRAVAGRAAGGRPSRRFLLAGLARCGRCGSRVYSRTSTYMRTDGTRARKYECAQVTDGTGLCDAPPLDAVSVDALVLERLPRFMSAAERWLRELGSDRRAVEARAERELTAAERSAADARARVANLTDRYVLRADADLHTPEAEALLGALVEARAALTRAERDETRAAREVHAVREALEGDALAVAYRSLSDALHGGEASAVAAFNHRLREHFECFLLDGDAPPLPIWRVELPPALATHVAELVDERTLCRHLHERVRELGLLPLTS